MIRFNMVRISVDQFAILADSLPENGGGVLNTSLSFAVDKKNHVISNRMRFEFKSKDSTMMILELTCYFEVHQNDFKGMVKNGKTTIPRDFLSHMAVHTVGTARGILFCKTESTPFRIFILPPLNVNEMIQEDFIESC